MDVGSWIESGAVLLVGALFIAVPVAFTILLLRVSFPRMSGRRGHFDRVFGALGGANAMGWHLKGGGPHPDDVNAVPPPSGARARRTQRR